MKQILMWAILGTKGGYNRAKIIALLKNRPYNANQISSLLDLNYRTITHHLSVLEEMHLIDSTGKNYGKLYFLSEEMTENYNVFEEIIKKME